MKIVKEVTETKIFKRSFKSEVEILRDYAKRIQNQFVVERYLKKNLRLNHIYIYIDFAED